MKTKGHNNFQIIDKLNPKNPRFLPRITIPNINYPEKFINILRDAIRKEIKNEKEFF